jgi:class 3 adenylate cyclase
MGAYTLEEPLGAGGMGIVYRAQQHIGLTTRPVAVKLIHPVLLRTAREEALARFQAEMGTLVKLEQESIARICDGGIGEDPHTHEPLPYIAMELVRGGLPLTTYAQDHALTWQERLSLFLRVCRAVQYAHEHRIVHRDLKPANILVDSEGRPFVIDFGLAQACDALLPGVHLAASGTPAYMSPEQVSDAWGTVSAKSDVYALGLLLYELLTGQPPYALPPNGTWEQLRDVVTTATPRPLSQHRPEYHGELEALVAQALAKRPTDRCSVAMLRSRLERFVQAQPAGFARVEGERKQVTVLCADIQEYTPWTETLGEEVVYSIMDQIYKNLITAVHQEEGTVQDLTGDGILALFGAPGALENAPLRACRAALTIQAQLRSVGVEVEAKHGVHPKVRIGIHTGPVVVGMVGTDRRMEYKAVGDTVHLAARLELMATPGSILLSEATYRLVEGYVQSTLVGERDVKGKRVPQRVYHLAGLKAGMARFDIARQRGLTPLIGRERELERLKHHCDAVQQNSLHMVHVVGEAGIGKSRLIHEFHQCLRTTPVLFLQGHCTAAGRSTSFLPFIEVVRGLFGLGEGEDQPEVTRKIRHGLESLGMPPDTSLPLLLPLLGLEGDTPEVLQGLDGEIIGARMREALQGLLQQRCRSAPIVLCLEDLHWIDTASEALLRQIILSEVRMPLLLLCASRPP